ncbi:hypothetical protein FA15DRAFT_661170 [Coprinopsis marcescibilis]|uniref:Uncharacterized protein n=1 Tax=Coprinopsis marcescibilis TaxID=230819 RepID=A0A5C3KCZ3_COPMA|nr:hypothetical protein FA15DRAFT_661170 [Coprinopsis marcescibilis]
MSSATSISTASTSISTASTVPDDSVLWRLHSHIQELELEVAELMTCNANLNLKIATHTRRRKPCGAKAPLDKPPSGNGDSASQEATDLVEYIDASAKKASFIYLHLYSPYLLPGVFGKAKPAFKHNSLDRYADSVSLEEGQAADLYAAVPEEDHEFVSLHPFGHPVYAQKFKEHLTAHRGNLAKCARQVAPFLFSNKPNIPAGIFKASESKSCLDNERIRALTGYAAHRNPRWPRYAPVLYANESSHGEDFLLNPVVIQSPNALSSVPELRATDGLMSTCGTMDSPSLITPATIASPSVTLSSIHQQAPVAIASSTPASLITPATTGSTVAQALTTTSPSTGSSGGAPDPQPARHRATRATSAANNEENATASGSGSKASRGGKRGRGKRA